MRHPKRYNAFAMFQDEVAYYEMRRDVAGHYVEYESYAKLEADYNALEKKNMELRREILRLTRELEKLKVAQ
jgi:cell division protein FtsB